MVVATPGTGLAAKLPSTTTADADVQGTVAVDRAPTGSGSYVLVVARRVPGAGGYRSTVRVLPDGSVTVALLQFAANGTVVATLQPETLVPGLRAAPGERLRVRTQATGTSPTTVRAKVWRAAAAEPAPWTASQLDGTAPLQAPGYVALGSYVSSTATAEPVTFTFDDLVVAPTG